MPLLLSARAAKTFESACRGCRRTASVAFATNTNGPIQILKSPKNPSRHPTFSRAEPDISLLSHRTFADQVREFTQPSIFGNVLHFNNLSLCFDLILCAIAI